SNVGDQIFQPRKITDVTFQAVRAVCGRNFTYVVGAPGSGMHMMLTNSNQHQIMSSMPSLCPDWQDIGATWGAVFILQKDGSLTAWGQQNRWALVPHGLPDLAQIAIGTDHVLALTTNGHLLSWGWMKHGNCGDVSAHLI